MKYQERKDWKYEVFEDCTIILNYHYDNVDHPLFSIFENILKVKKGYRWDGATCAIDTENFMVPSLAHDIIFQAMREGLLDRSNLKKANKELKKLCLEREMWSARAWWVHRGVTLAGDKYIKSDIIEVK